VLSAGSWHLIASGPRNRAGIAGAGRPGGPGIWASRPVPRPPLSLRPVPVPGPATVLRRVSVPRPGPVSWPVPVPRPVPISCRVPVPWPVSVRWPRRHGRPIAVSRASAPPGSATGASAACVPAFRQWPRGGPLLSPRPLRRARPPGWPPTLRAGPRHRSRRWLGLPALEPWPPFLLPRLRRHSRLGDRPWRRRGTRGRVRCPDRKRGRAGSVLLPAHGLPRASRGSYDGSIRQAPV
jgi:hypothetical protein